MIPSKKKKGLEFLDEILHTACLLNLRSNRKLFGIVRFIDKHFNVILTDAIEIRRSVKKCKETKKKEVKIIERKIQNMVIRGDSIISISSKKTENISLSF